MLNYELNYPDFNNTGFIGLSSLCSGNIDFLSSAQNSVSVVCLTFVFMFQ